MLSLRPDTRLQMWGREEAVARGILTPEEALASFDHYRNKDVISAFPSFLGAS